MKTILVVLTILLFLTTSVCPQSNNKADSFHGLVLNETTSEAATRILGQPSSDKVDRIDLSKLNKWLDPKIKEKIFRQLAFKDVGDFSRIQLSFLENKLVMIELEFKKNLGYWQLDHIFGLEFAVVGLTAGPFELPNAIGKYPARFIPDHFPFNYNLIGISEHTFIWVDCSTNDAARPGRVDRTWQVSRVLQKK